MKYGAGPRVPTYDYGPSDRKLRGSSRSMESSSMDSQRRFDRRGYSDKSIESTGSTLEATVVNHSRNMPSYAPKQLPQRESYHHQDENSSNGQFRRFSHGSVDGEDAEDYNLKQDIHRQPTATSSTDYSEASLEPKRGAYGRATHGAASPVERSLAASGGTGTIAVFGAATKTGQAFVRLALDAGYTVRALLGVGARAPEPQVNLEWVVGNLNDEAALRECVDGADFVVCTLSEHKFKKQKNLLREFVQRLYPIMKEEESIQVFLFQSCSLANDLNGKTPVLSKVIKTVTKRGSHSLRDQDNIIRFINSQHNPGDAETAISNKPSFSFLVTRPTILIKEGPSIKKLSASKSQPGPFSVTHIDLAEFSLNALLNTKLHNACPYVVADSGL